MLLSVVTVAFRNYEGVMKTWRSLAHLAGDPSLTFEWIVVDGGSDDGTAEFLEKRNGQYQLRYVSEPDKGLYDAMNKGIFKDLTKHTDVILKKSYEVMHGELGNVDSIQSWSNA